MHVPVRTSVLFQATDGGDPGHNSAFEALYNPPGLVKLSILLNGTGNYTRFSGQQNTSEIPSPYQLHFDRSSTKPQGRPKRYFLRLINTSFRTTFIFSIDNHWLQIIGADFVPIEPYYNTTLLIGIGQRYHVVVEADPVREDGNYWIRTWVANGCGRPGQGDHYERTGILRYDNDSTSDPKSNPWTDAVSFACSDETYTSLKPKLPWFVGQAKNGRRRVCCDWGPQ